MPKLHILKPGTYTDPLCGVDSKYPLAITEFDGIDDLNDHLYKKGNAGVTCIRCVRHYRAWQEREAAERS